MPLTLPRWIAHRGGGSLAPENTLAGIRLAARFGFKAVEFDVMLSGDGTPVLIHDETLDRTTNGTGRVCDTNDATLFALDAGQCERIPTYADAVTLCRQLGLLANVEIKPARGHETQTAETVARQSLELWRNAAIPPLFSSFSPEVLGIARDLAPAIPRGLLFEHVPPDWPAQLHALAAVTLHCNAAGLSDATLTEAAARRIPVLCYTVNDATQARHLCNRGIHALFTDRLDLFAPENAGA